MISVILVTYNSMPVLPDCIQSLERSSSAKELQLVVVDNGSVDGTLEWLKGYETSGEFPFVEVITMQLKNNHGFAYGNNRGMEQARGQMLLLLNPDTVVGRDAIDACARALAADSRIGAIGCRLVLLNDKLDRACKRSFPTLWNSFARFIGLSILFPQWRLFSGYNLTYLDEHRSYPVDCLSGAFMMVPAAVRSEVGGLDEDYFMYGEDIDWCYRIKQAGYEVWYQGSVSALHLKGGNGGKRTPTSLWHFYHTMAVYYRKRHPSTLFFLPWQLLRIFLGIAYFTHLFMNTRYKPGTASKPKD